MKHFLNLEQYKSILCLNGDLPEVDFFDKNLPIIAADGAANSLINMGIKPSMVIGDLDSITADNQALENTHLHYDQNFCDFEKSLDYLKKNDLLPSIIVGLNGGFIDHILNNINHFVTTNSILYAPPIYGFTMRANEKKSFILPLNTKISYRYSACQHLDKRLKMEFE